MVYRKSEVRHTSSTNNNNLNGNGTTTKTVKKKTTHHSSSSTMCCNVVGDVFRLGILVGIVVALIFEFWTTYSCNFIKNGNGGGTTVGIWYLGYDDDGDKNTCYDKETHYETDDGFIKSSRSGVTLSMICGFGAGVCILFEWLCCELPLFGCLEGLMLTGAWFFGAASFLMYGSQGCANIQGMIENESTETIDGKVNCKYGAASTYMVIACLSYTICHFLLCCAPQPRPIFRR